jgi:hypothetical protein
VAAFRKGVPLWGVCLYPIIDRPDWDHFTPWHQAGLWDAELHSDGQPDHRVLYEPYAKALRKAQAKVAAATVPKARPTSLSLSLS